MNRGPLLAPDILAYHLALTEDIHRVIDQEITY